MKTTDLIMVQANLNPNKEESSMPLWDQKSVSDSNASSRTTVPKILIGFHVLGLTPIVERNGDILA